jgi:Domain of unknown function (DUF222)/HNH endonuclease
MPETDAAFAAGDIGLAQALRLAELNGGRTEAAFAEAEADLVDNARSMDRVDFSRSCAYWRQAVDPDSVEADAADDESQRRLHLSEGMSGTGILDAILTPLGRATVGEALQRITDELFEADWAEARDRLGDAVRRAIELRDRHCTFPGCHAPADRCEVDHIVPFAYGGPTSQANGRLGCKPDHRHRHRRESGR